MNPQNPLITPPERETRETESFDERHEAIVDADARDARDADARDGDARDMRDPRDGDARAVRDPRDGRNARDIETPYLNDQTSSQVNERWKRVQAEFVDDPQKSVAQAHELVGELVQRIVDSFTEERNELERQWSKGDSVSTEDLRVCLQRYRAFFTRLLPTANATHH